MRSRSHGTRGWRNDAVGSAAAHHRRVAAIPTRIAMGRRGLSLAEVLVAAGILVVAGLAALELLAGADRASLEGRRLALAATEAEHALSDAAVRLARGES
ncbi:MAG: hypothetical protein RI967_316, partial [Planctomycetota bacterium]